MPAQIPQFTPIVLSQPSLLFANAAAKDPEVLVELDALLKNIDGIARDLLPPRSPEWS